MLLAKVPYHTIEGNAKIELRKLKNGLGEFEKIGFASALSESPVEYADLQLRLVRNLISDSELWADYSNEITGLFVKEYFLRTMLFAADENLWETLDLQRFYVQFKNMQSILREVFPYWIDNDYLYGLGKNYLNILKSSNMEISDEEQLKLLLNDIAILGLPPAVSIVMPTYNRADLLVQTIPKILNQTYSNFELLIIDDGSDDNTREVVELFPDERIKYLRLEENGGQSKARNIGIQNASYAYIAFADSDDFWEEKKLEVQMEALLKQSEAGFCYCVHTYHTDDGKTVVIPDRNIPMVRKEGYIYPELLRRNLTESSALIVKKECIEIVGGFNESLECLEDWEFLLRLARSYSAVFCPESLFEAYEIPNQISSKPKETGKKAMELFYENFGKDRILFNMTDEVY